MKALSGELDMHLFSRNTRNLNKKYALTTNTMFSIGPMDGALGTGIKQNCEIPPSYENLLCGSQNVTFSEEIQGISTTMYVSTRVRAPLALHTKP